MTHSSDKSLASPPIEAFSGIPPFPNTVQTAPLVRISLLRLANSDVEEQNRLWQACCDLGFFYLDMRMQNQGSVSIDGNLDNVIDGDAILNEKDQLFDLMKDLYALPEDEKSKYNRSAEGIYFGYKGFGANILDRKGTRDRNEYWNVSKNDMLGDASPQPNPNVITDQRSLFASYITHTHAVCSLIMKILNDRLRLPADRFANWHRLHGPAGDQVRLIHSPPQLLGDRTLSNGEHTDFGSVTVLFNKVGGLQIRLPPGLAANPPSSPLSATDSSTNGHVPFSQDGSPMTSEEESEWAYVVPLAGHAIINLGDAMTKFSAGILRSNIHRVISPPGAQAELTRYSLVYFTRPEYEVKLKYLGDESELVSLRRREMGLQNEGKEEEVYTSREWVNKMSLGRRNMDSWTHSGGKEMDRARQGLRV